MHEMTPNPDRRKFLKAGAALTGGALLAPWLTSCGGANDAPTTGNQAAGNAGNAAGDAGETDNDRQPVDQPPARKTHPPMKRGSLLGGGKRIYDDGTERWGFTMLNLDVERGQIPNPRWIEVGFFVHGVVKNPTDPGRMLLVEKQRHGGCEVDIEKGEVIQTVKPARGCEFYGHAAFSPDAAYVYTTEYVSEEYTGRISVRDGRTFEVLDHFPSHGEWPHDCFFIDGGRVMVVTNGGGPIGGEEPSVAYIEVATGKLLEKLSFTNPNIRAGHLLLSSKEDLAVACAVRQGFREKEDQSALCLRPKGGEWRIMTEPADVCAAMTGETLSLAMHEPSGVVVATNPWADLVTYWSMPEQRFLGKLTGLKQPKGVAMTLDGEFFVITYGLDPHIVLVSTKSLKRIKGSDIPVNISGSHVFVHDFPV